jgi:uncharacterized protein (DUF1697 family)
VALVVLLRGINVGGHRRFRPAELARRLRHLDAVNVGAAGTFVIREPIARSRLRAVVAQTLPFAAEIAIFDGRDLAGLLAGDHFAGEPERPDVVRFVSVLASRPRLSPPLPISVPAGGEWLVRVLAREGRFLVGVHRRRMRAIGALGALDRLFGAPATTRSWTTMVAVAGALGGAPRAGS